MTPAWVEAAARMPVAFAQVREDPRLDLDVITRVGSGARVMMIASGGCTAALLASGNVRRLHLVDANPAQLALTRLKLHLLQTAAPTVRLAVLGHAPMPEADRAFALQSAWTALELPCDSLGDEQTVARLGPDHAGRYELNFAELRRAFGEHGAALQAVLSLPDPGEREALLRSEALGAALDAAFESAMALPWLQVLFSPQATQNSVEPFSKHFAARVRIALRMDSPDINPFLWQMLTGRFPSGVSYDWLTAPAPAGLPELTFTQSTMDRALESVRAEFDVVHLSNILDWLTQAQAARTLTLAHQALRPGGYVLIRQLNSSLNVRALGDRFTWLARDSDEFERRDRSFFYRRLHLGVAR